MDSRIDYSGGEWGIGKKGGKGEERRGTACFLYFTVLLLYGKIGRYTGSNVLVQLFS